MKVENGIAWLLIVILIVVLGVAVGLSRSGDSSYDGIKFGIVYAMDGYTYMGDVTDIQKGFGDSVKITLDGKLTIWTSIYNVTLLSEVPNYVKDFGINNKFMGRGNK